MVKGRLQGFLRDALRAWRGHRRARAAVVAATSVLVVASVGIAVVAPSGGDEGYHDPYVPPPRAQTACADAPAREVCFDLDGDVRYALLKAPEPTAETVILDFGGPGLPILSGEANLTGFAADHSRLSGRYNLLLLEEPWVVTEMPSHAPAADSSCPQAMQVFYRAVREAAATLRSRGADLAEACDLSHHRWGFDPEVYPTLVERVLDRHALDLRGFVGHSWGSVRLRYLAGFDFEFAALVRPFPVGVTPQLLVERRAEAITSAAPASLRPIKSTQLDSRSLPVSYVDQLSAAVALGYLDDEHFGEVAEAVFAGERPNEIGRLSDQLWGRYDVESLSQAKLAQWQEICRTVDGPMPELPDGPLTSVRDLLTAEFAPCVALSPVRLPQMAAGDWTTTSRNPPGRPSNCVVTAASDTVTPEPLIFSAFRFIPEEDITWVASEEQSHRSMDGLIRCLDEVVPGR